MNQLNILLKYSNEKDRKQLTELLHGNGFLVTASFHAIENIEPLNFSPDIAIIQFGIHSPLVIDGDLKAKYPSIKTILWASITSNYLPGYVLSSDDIVDFLQQKQLQKKQKLIATVRLIHDGLFSENFEQITTIQNS